MQVRGAVDGSWKCPDCGRTFARAKQAHSCQVVSLELHLDKAGAEVRKIYAKIVAALSTMGPFEAVPTKTGINLMSRTSLGGIRLLRDKAKLGIVMLDAKQSPRIQKILRLSARSHVHYIDVATVGEVDKELLGWLREAHAVGMMAGRRPS